MNEQDYQLISRYVDGELDDVSVQRLEQRLAAEPGLRDTLDQFRALDSKLRHTFRDTDTVPERVQAMVRPAAESAESVVVPFTRRQSRPTWHYAVAASLVAAAGLLLTPQWQDSNPGAPTLASVLETTPSTASDWASLADGRQIRPVLSFRSVDGEWCREYLVAMENSGERGVACRHDGQWQVRVTATAQIPGGASEFRPAGAGDADVIADFLAEQADDIALSAAEEHAVIAKGWQR